MYTSQSVLSFKFESLDSALMVVETYVVPAQTISIYSYREDPYKYRNIYEEYSSMDPEQLESASNSSLHSFLLSMACTEGIRQVCHSEDEFRQRSRSRRRRKKYNHKK